MSRELTPDDVERVEMDGGYVELLNFDEAIFIMNVVSKGNGNKVLRFLKILSRMMGKPIYGEIQRMGEGMDETRLRRWYELHGGKVVANNGHDVIRFEG